MAVPRPILLALLATILLAVTFMATMTSRKQAVDQTAVPAPTQPPGPGSTKPAQPAGLAPADVAKAVFTPGQPIAGASFDIRVNAQELGGRHEREALRLTGAFQAGEGKVPSFDLRTSQVNAHKAEHSHVRSTGDKGFLFDGATGYAMPAAGFAGVTAFRAAIAKAASNPAAQAPQPDPSGWLKDIKREQPVKVGGVKTEHISARIDPKLASADVRKLVTAVGAASSQPVALPKRLGAKVERALRSARLDAWVGTQDRIVRRLAIDARGKLPPELLDKGETARWQVGLDVNLTKVNQPQKIGVPAKASPRTPAVALGKKQAKADAGVFTLGAVFADPPASIGQTTLGLLQSTQQVRAQRKPRAASRAVGQHKRVVIFFHQARGLDDSITDDAVAALRKRSSVMVIEDSVANVAGYGQVVMSVGVSRAPSIVIIGKSGRARLLEGYIDSGALAQEVADTR
jgi:hypothetical protein